MSFSAKKCKFYQTNIIEFNKIYKKASLTLLLKIMGSIGSYLLTLIISRRFGVSILGDFTLFITYLQILSVIGKLGLDTYTLKITSIYRENREIYRLNNLLPNIIFIQLIWMVLLLFLINILPVRITHKNLLEVALIPFCILFITNQIIRSIHNTYLFIVLQDIAIFYITIVLILFNFNLIKSYVLAIFFTSFVSIIFAFKIINFTIDFRPKISKIVDILRDAVVFMLNNSLFMVMGWIDILMISYFMSKYQVGLYTVAVKISMLFSLLWVSLNSFLAPHFSKPSSEIVKFYSSANKLLLFSSVLLYLLLVIFGGKILEVFGKQFYSVRPVMFILVTGQLLKHFFGLNIDLLNIKGYQKELLLITIAMIAINFSLNLILIRILGLIGAAIATSFTISIGAFARYTIVKTRIFSGDNYESVG